MPIFSIYLEVKMKIKNDNMDRREFISRAARVAAAATAFGIFTPVSPSRAVNGRKLKIAIVGTGKRGTVTWGERLLQLIAADA
jgi:hypothetical protein